MSPSVPQAGRIPIGDLVLEGELDVPSGAIGVVAFAHGSGSSRLSPRNRLVAARLRERRLGTLLFDLLTAEEEGDRTNVFDVPLLGGRLASVVSWLTRTPAGCRLPIGLFGASTGAAAAVWAATEPGCRVEAIVSRGGRPDLAGERLPLVAAPTLLVAGGADPVVLELNREAAALLRCEHRLAVVPGAGHLFEEPGALDAVAALAGGWFVEHLGRPASDRAPRVQG